MTMNESFIRSPRPIEIRPRRMEMNGRDLKVNGAKFEIWYATAITGNNQRGRPILSPYMRLPSSTKPALAVRSR